MKFNCDSCNTEYNEMENFEVYKQAEGCSASLYLQEGKYYITAYYGSRYDMNRYLLRVGADFKLGQICDTCINKLIDSGDAVLVEKGIW